MKVLLSSLRTVNASILSRRLSSSAAMATYKFETLLLHKPREFVYHVELNRPDKRNAMNKAFWSEMSECFNRVADDDECRVVVFSGAGKMFSSGIDLTDFSEFVNIVQSEEDIARKAKALKKLIHHYQAAFTSLEKCPKPVIVAIHGACVGGGVDLISACDVRYCTQDAWFQIKEVDIGLAADVGTLQRLPKVVGNDSLIRELAYTARKMHSDEAHRCGLVSRVFENREAMMNAAVSLAGIIASKSPVAVQGSKVNLNYSRDHTVDESLDFMSHWNMTMLQSEDVMKSAMAALDKSGKPATFSKL